MSHKFDKIRSTTVIAVKRDGKVAMAGDGQVTMGNTIMKGNARKSTPDIRRKSTDRIRGRNGGCFYVIR